MPRIVTMAAYDVDPHSATTRTTFASTS